MKRDTAITQHPEKNGKYLTSTRQKKPGSLNGDLLAGMNANDHQNSQTTPPSFQNRMKVMIADGEPAVRQAMHDQLSKIEYRGRPLSILSLDGHNRILDTLKEHPDTAVILVDTACLNQTDKPSIIRRIREAPENKMVRIIVRTGQPDTPDMAEIFYHDDINDLISEKELSSSL
ncbi:MAG: hypothetical protein MI922_28865 [Bacteroidales bacterium]|nr:hypothetical protein [Bacteroidales bacterium]